MKNNLDKSKPNVCKEEVLMCIFKDVPNYLPEDQEGVVEASWVGGSHHEVVVGRRGSPASDTETSTTAVTHKHSGQDGLQENTDIQTTLQKLNKKLPGGESTIELKLWSSPFPSEECLPRPFKKSQKIKKKTRVYEDCQWVLNDIISDDSFATIKNGIRYRTMKTEDLCEDCCWVFNSIMSNISLTTIQSDKRYKPTMTEELCEECFWLERATKSSESLRGTYPEEESIKKRTQSSANQISTKSSGLCPEYPFETAYMKNYHKKQVTRLLNEVQSSLLECSILLTTQKLHKKVRKSELDGNLDNETPSENDVLFDQIQAEEGSTGRTSKLCLAIGRLVTKYLKVW